MFDRALLEGQTSEESPLEPSLGRAGSFGKGSHVRPPLNFWQRFTPPYPPSLFGPHWGVSTKTKVSHDGACAQRPRV